MERSRLQTAQSTSDRSSLTTVDLGDVLLVKAAHYIAPKASVNSPRLSKVTGCRPSKRRDVYSFSILSISISFSILKFLSQSLLWICSSSFLLPLEYKSRSVLLPPIMCSSELVFQVSLTYCVRSHHQRRVRRLSCRWRRLNQLTKGKWFCAKGEPPMTGSNLDACVTKNPFCLTQC
jgi:hypothetical protein